jgi:hypothetical protein
MFMLTLCVMQVWNTTFEQGENESCLFVTTSILLSPFSNKSWSSIATLVFPSLSPLRAQVLPFLSSPQVRIPIITTLDFILEFKLLLPWSPSLQIQAITAMDFFSLSLNSSSSWCCPSLFLFKLELLMFKLYYLLRLFLFNLELELLLLP